jgi:hypothetical protein
MLASITNACAVTVAGIGDAGLALRPAPVRGPVELNLMHVLGAVHPFRCMIASWHDDEERTIMKIPGLVIVLLTVGAFSALAQESPGEQIKDGAKKTGEAIKDTAKEVGRTTKSTAKTVGRKTKEAWRETKAKTKEVTEERE